MARKPNFTLVLDPETRADLEAVARAEDRSAGAVTRRAIEDKVREAEELGLIVRNGVPQRLKNGRLRTRKGSKAERMEQAARRKAIKARQTAARDGGRSLA